MFERVTLAVLLLLGKRGWWSEWIVLPRCDARSLFPGTLAESALRRLQDVVASRLLTTPRKQVFQPVATIVAVLSRQGRLPREPLLRALMSAGLDVQYSYQLISELMEGLHLLVSGKTAALAAADGRPAASSGLEVDASAEEYDAFVDANAPSGGVLDVAATAVQD